MEIGSRRYLFHSSLQRIIWGNRNKINSWGIENETAAASEELEIDSRSGKEERRLRCEEDEEKKRDVREERAQ